jgi:hypothetical protein
VKTACGTVWTWLLGAAILHRISLAVK